MSEISNPYKPLFTLGALSGILGALLWWFFKIDLISFYPRQAHIQIMFFSFLWSFVAGFLMTAIPRMTSSHLANNYEVMLAIVLVLLQTGFNTLNFTTLAVYVYFAQILLILFFILSRFAQKRKIPFDGFFFMPTAFIMCVLGLFLYIFFQEEKYIRLFSGEAFIMNLILGLGSRLIPALSRLPNALMHPGIEFKLNLKTVFIKIFVLNLSYFLESSSFFTIAYFLRLAVLFSIAVNDFGLFKKSTTFSWVGMGLKTGIIMMLLSPALKLLSISIIPSAHLFYIGGISLITIMVATRVSLAHSETSLDYELKSFRIVLIICSLIVSAIARWLAGSELGLWLLLSILLFAISFLIWLDKHLRLILSSKIQMDS